jgi:hypothetical protein
MVAAGIYYHKEDNDFGFKGECFCLSGPENNETLDGILRGCRVNAKNDGTGKFVVRTPLQEETLTVAYDEGPKTYQITCTPSLQLFEQVLETTATENMCIDIDTYAGLWRAEPGDDTILTANAYYWVPTTVDTACQYATKITQDTSTGIVTMETPGENLEFQSGKIVNTTYKRVGKLGERAGPNDYYDRRVFSNGTYGLVFAYESGVCTGYVGPVKGDATQTANWDRDNTVAVNFGTALTFGDETNGTACFIGEYAHTDSVRRFSALGVKNKLYVGNWEETGSYQEAGTLTGELPTPTTPSPPSGGGGGGGGGGDDTGLMVALLLGLLGYALLKS